jgi:hypothetical protein
MVKTHQKTGLKYLCKTTKNPFKYDGSGVDWLTHLKKYGFEYDTEVIMECANQKELYYWGSYYSKIWNVVSGQDDYGNKIWANRIPETGGGGGGDKESHKKISDALKGKSTWNKGISGWKCDPKTNVNKSLSKQGNKNPQYGKSRTVDEKNSISSSIKDGWDRSILICPNCGMSGKQNMKRWHFTNCKSYNI